MPRAFAYLPCEPKRNEKLVRLAFACLLASAQLLASAHLGLVAHRTCLEHGEAIHAGPNPPAAATEPSQTLAIASRSLDGGAHEHEHCLSLAHGRERMVQATAAACRIVPAAPVLAVFPGGASLPGSTVDVLSLAPKGSPPSA